MKCDEIQKRIDLELSKSSAKINPTLMAHVESCEQCGLYYKEALKLKELLNGQSFEALPGELDDITYEKIIGDRKLVTAGKGVFGSVFSSRWAWVPAAVAAILILFLVAPNINDINNGEQKVAQGDSTYLIDGLYVQSEQEVSELADSLVSDRAELDLLADELIYGSEIDDLLESLTDDEFEMLYERLKNMNGSSG